MNRFLSSICLTSSLIVLCFVLSACDTTKSYRLPTKDDIVSAFDRVEPREGGKDISVNRDGAEQPKTQTDSANNTKPVTGEAQEQMSYQRSPDASDGNFFTRLFGGGDDKAENKAPVQDYSSMEGDESRVGQITAPPHQETQTVNVQSAGDRQTIMIEAEKSFDTCPDIAVIGELSQIFRFRPDNTTNHDNLESSIQMLLLEENCVQIGDETKIELTFGFRGEIGPKAKVKPEDRTSFSYPYFIAVTKNEAEIVSKKIHAITMAYDPDQDTIITQDTIDETLKSDINTGNLKVLIGFQLTPEQLSYNREMLSEMAQ